MTEMLSQHEETQRTTATNSKPIRGSRIRSTVGLNITEYEFVLLKFKEKEDKKNRVKKPRLPKGGKTTKISTNGSTNSKGKTTLKKGIKNKENQIPKDAEVQFAIQSLQNAIDFTQQELMSDSSDKDW